MVGDNDTLSKGSCIPCQVGAPILEREQIHSFLKKLERGWTVNAEQHLWLELTFSDFLSALHFVNQLTELAEQEQHHPDLRLGWGYVHIELWTHKAGGITQSDLVMAAKIDKLTVPSHKDQISAQ